MMKHTTRLLNKSIWLIPCMMLLGILSLQHARTEEDQKGQLPGLKVGTYDSRAIAMAYYRSELFSKYISEQHAALKAAREKGDASGVQTLNEKGKAIQSKAHRQGFGSAPVDEIIAHIKNKLPAIADKAGVDLIVSKWKLDYLAPGVQCADITNLMVEPFSPSHATLKVIQDIQKKDPISLEELENHQH